MTSFSGTHWHREIVRMLLVGSPDYDTGEGEVEFFDAFPVDKLLPPDKPRVLFTHFR